MLYNKSDQYYEFLAEDMEAINRTATYRVLFDLYASELDDFYKSSHHLIDKIDKNLAGKLSPSIL